MFARVRIEKETEKEGTEKAENGYNEVFYSPGDPFNSHGIRAAREMSRKLELRPGVFGYNVTRKTREITPAELNPCRHYAHTLHAI